MHLSLYVCGPELLREGYVTACAEGPRQADVPSCRSSSAVLGVGARRWLLPAPFVHLRDTPTGSTDLQVAASSYQNVTFRPPGILRPKDLGRGNRTGQPGSDCQDNGFLPPYLPETARE